MAEKKADNILRNPKFGFLLYADGHASLVLESKPAVNQEGEDVMEFVLSPTDDLIKDYNLKVKPPRDDFVYKVQIPYEFVIQLNPSPHFTRWFYLKNYNGDIPPAIKSIFPTTLIQEIKDLKSQIRRKDMEIDIANEDRDLIKTNLPAYMKKNVFSIMEAAAPIIEKMNPDKKL